MKAQITPDLRPDTLVDRVPPPYREHIPLAQLHAARYTLVVFAASRDEIILSGAVRRALASVPLDTPLVVAGPGFTVEALDLLTARDALVCALGQFHWTDSSYEKVRQATRLPRQ